MLSIGLGLSSGNYLSSGDTTNLEFQKAITEANLVDLHCFKGYSRHTAQSIHQTLDLMQYSHLSQLHL